MRHRRADGSRVRSVRRVALVVIAGCVGIAGASWLLAVTRSTQETFAAKNAEWMRDHHLGSVVDRIERYQIEHDQPPVGGTPSAALIRPGAPSLPAQGAAKVPGGVPPDPMPSPAPTPFVGEGAWSPAGPPVRGGGHGVYTTVVRPNSTTTSLVDFVARVDPRLVDVQLVPGSDLPGGTWSHQPQITAKECPRAILAMNGGFRFDQSGGGWYADGHQAPDAPLIDGAASLVRFKDSTMDVVAWGRSVGTADLGRIESVRQNLQLMVDRGKVLPGIDDAPSWGAKLKNSLMVWRSGFGITSSGDLVYVGGPGLTPRDLAQRLVDAGAVRAMQGDINPSWVAANLYHDGPDGCHGTRGLDAPHSKGGQQSSGDRYLSPDTRDFVLVLARES